MVRFEAAMVRFAPRMVRFEAAMVRFRTMHGAFRSDDCAISHRSPRQGSLRHLFGCAQVRLYTERRLRSY
jgi:hypothetical protein